MKGSTVFLIAALAVLLILVVYAVARDPDWAPLNAGFWLANYVESPWQVYRRSSGEFDDAAALALRRATSRANPTPGEHLLAATVLTRNVLGRAHRPEVGPDGAPTPAAVEGARTRQRMFAEARRHYMEALRGLGAERPPPRRAELDGEGFIIDAATRFAFGGLADLLENDPLLAEGGLWPGGGPWQPQWVTFQAGPAGIFAVDAPLAAEAGRRREEVVAARRGAAREAARQHGGAPAVAVDTYVELARQNTDDPQNAHDTGVLACLRAIVDRLRADQAGQAVPPVGTVVAAIRAEGAALSEGRPRLVEEAVAAAEKTAAGEEVHKIGATDGECLGRVWLRASDPRNAAVAGKMRQSVFDALADCWEDGIAGRKIVCVNGRTSRILSALTLLDWDRRNWEVKKLEQFKNDIFERAARVVADRAAAAAADPDPGRAKAGRAYLAKTAAEMRAVGEVPPAAAEALAEDMKGAVGEMVDAFVRDLQETLGNDDAIPPYLVASVKEEAMAAVQ
jgi:hypothetical protein